MKTHKIKILLIAGLFLTPLTAIDTFAVDEGINPPLTELPPPDGTELPPPEGTEPPPEDPMIEYVIEISNDLLFATDEMLTEALESLSPEQILHLLHHPSLDDEDINIILDQLDLSDIDLIFDHPDLGEYDPAKILLNLDPATMSIADMQAVLPEGWSIEEDGDLRPPPGGKIVLPQKLPPLNMPNNFDMPDSMPDFSKDFALGGQNIDGISTIDEMNGVLAGDPTAMDDPYGFATFSQDENGFMDAVSRDNRQFAFMPDSEDMEQADESDSMGIFRDNGGFPMVTTAEKQRFKLKPAPKDPTALVNMFGNNSRMKLDNEGDLLAVLSNPESGEENHYAVIFDPEITTAPEGATEGIYMEGDEVFIVYPDRTAQKVKPTVFLPETFIEITKKFQGVEEVTYNIDGTITVIFLGDELIIEPNYSMESSELGIDETFESEIIPHIDENRVVYALLYEEEEIDSTKNVRSSRRKKLTFNLPIRCKNGEGSDCLSD